MTNPESSQDQSPQYSVFLSPNVVEAINLLPEDEALDLLEALEIELDPDGESITTVIVNEDVDQPCYYSTFSTGQNVVWKLSTFEQALDHHSVPGGLSEGLFLCGQPTYWVHQVVNVGQSFNNFPRNSPTVRSC